MQVAQVTHYRVSSQPGAAVPAPPGEDAAAPARAALAGDEAALCEAAERTLRNPQGRMVVVLHLSRLAAQLPHRLRVARVLMDDAARRGSGQVYAMRNHDLVLLCDADASMASGAMGRPAAPGSLAGDLCRLFGADAPDPGQLVSAWLPERDGAPLRAYLAQRAGAQKQPADDGRPGQLVGLVGLQEIVARAPLAGLMVQQTGLSLSPDRQRPLAARLSPAFQQVGVGLDLLGLPSLLGQALGDPFLARHFAGELPARLIGLLQEDLQSRGRLLRAARMRGLPVLVELGLRSVVSPGFSRLVRLADDAGLRLWVAVSLAEAGADLDVFEHARGLLRLAGCSLVVQLDPAAIGLLRPEVLRPDLIVLPWSQSLRTDAAAWPHLALWQQEGARLVLSGVDGEQALAWGQSHGVSLFQGAYLDQVQAATRMQACHGAPACTLRQCAARARALAPPGRVGCGNPALLDGAK